MKNNKEYLDNLYELEDLEDLIEEEEEEEEEDEEDRGDIFEPDEEEDEDNEDDESDEEEDEDDESEEEEDEEPPLNKEPKIPKSRLDEVIAQREEARERNLWLEEQLEKLLNQSLTPKQQQEVKETVKYDFDKAEEDYITLIIEGDISKASKLRAEIDKERRNEMMSLLKELEENATVKAKSESNVAVENNRFNSLIENFENKYKFLNPDTDEYNEEAVETVNTLLAGYVASGKSKTEGLRLAVNKVAPLYVKEVTTKKTIGNKRKVDAGKKAAKAAKSQPAKTKSSTNKPVDLNTVNISKMSEKDFSKLTVKEKKLLRGD